MKTTRNLYLKTMYLLSIQEKEIRVTDIANKLNFTKSSVSKALVRLKESNMINYESYGEITLNKEAILIAQDIIKKENLLELFFIGVLNINDKTAKKDIDIISEHVSNETKDKLKEYIISSLHLNDEKCKCNSGNPSCNTCQTKVIQKRVTANEEWVNTLKEEK